MTDRQWAASFAEQSVSPFRADALFCMAFCLIILLLLFGKSPRNQLIYLSLYGFSMCLVIAVQSTSIMGMGSSIARRNVLFSPAGDARDDC